ncbi:MAG: 6-phosphogluconolactonase [Anaerolineales bacterium]|jgi:6-phosphogluconolactonase
MIQIFHDLPEVQKAAADLFLTLSGRSIRESGTFSVALSGGSTPEGMYRLLASPSYRDRIDWRRIYFFWGDERCVPVFDARSNVRMAREAFLDRVPVSPAGVFPMRCDQDPAAGAAAYEAELRGHFGPSGPRFDLVLLGLGENGHTASLFPYTPVLGETQRWVAEVYVPDQKLYRLTLTPASINQAREVVFLVSGQSKAEAARAVLEGEPDPERFPAQLIRPQDGEVHWLLDEAAAARLSIAR